MNSTPEFFSVQPVQQALELLFDRWQPRQRPEVIEVRRALGRVPTGEARAQINLPTFRRSAVDGYAVRAADTYGASQNLPAYLTCMGNVLMGAEALIEVGQGQAVEVHTGGMLPRGADAVVMVERTQLLGAGELEVLAAVAPGENVIQVGEDIQQNDLILPVRRRLRPQDIGGLLAAGVGSIEVAAMPRVGILSCGDELVPPEKNPASGQVRDINSHMLAALVERTGGEPVSLGIARDTLAGYQACARAGLEAVDILVLTAGSSVSTRDLTRAVINDLGAPGILQHGLAVKPGKPTIIALCGDKPVIGLPGNPVSALLVARQIMVPIIERALGLPPRLQATIRARLTGNIASTTGREDSIPVRLIARDDGLHAEPIFGKSNLIFTLVRADGLVQVPLNSAGIPAGTMIDVVLLDV
jgi:molybdopterin molybdotransferase